MRIRVAAALAAVALLAGCSTPAPAPTGAVAPSASRSGDGVLRIGTLFPETGAAAYIEPAQSAGVALAVADINAAGGVAGTPVEVVAKDSGEASGTVLEASFAALVEAQVDVVIGPSSSLLAARLIPLAADAGVAVISPAATFPALSSIVDDGYFFRTIPAYAQQGVAISQELQGKKVALLYVDDEFGAALAPELATGLGDSLVLSQPVPPTTTDLSIVIDQLTAAGPDAVVLGSTYASVDLTRALITAVIAAGYGGDALWLTSQNAGDYSQALPAGTLTGVHGVIEGYQPDQPFIDRLTTVDSTLTTFRYAAEAYDATILAALAAVRGGDSGGAVASALGAVSVGGVKCGTYPECLAAAASSSDIDYDGVSGPLNFDPAGDISPAYYGLYLYDSENRFVFERGVLAG